MRGQAKIHFSSVNATLSMPDERRLGAAHPCPLVVFEEVTRSEGQLGVRACSAVSAHALPLVAALASMQEEGGEEDDDDEDAR